MIEWLAAFFVITGMWVWFWAAVCFVIVLVFAENERNLFAFITVAAFIALMHHSGIISREFKSIGLCSGSGRRWSARYGISKKTPARLHSA